MVSMATSDGDKLIVYVFQEQESKDQTKMQTQMLHINIPLETCNAFPVIVFPV